MRVVQRQVNGREVMTTELHEVIIDHGSTLVGPVTTTIPQGQVTVLQGASGSGKTSLCLAMTGFLTPNSGHIEGDIGILVPQNPREWLNPRLKVGQVLEHTMRIRRTQSTDPVDQGPGVHAARSAERPLDRDELLALALLSPEIAEHRCGELSGGQAARVCIARALASGIDTIVCDEPTAALDSSNAARIAWLINDLAASGKTMVWATHDRDLVAATNDGHSFVTL